LLGEIKARIARSRIEAAMAANHVLIDLYWHIGRSIVERQKLQKWGRSVVERLAMDIQSAFPEIPGFSRQNIWKMRTFYLTYSKGVAILSQPVRELPRTELARSVQVLSGTNLSRSMTVLDAPTILGILRRIPWGHNLELLFKLKDPVCRLMFSIS
jgi:hypothetical protein